MSESPVNMAMQEKITNWRRQALEGTLPLEEMKEAIAYLRAGRISALNASAAAKRKKAIVEIPKAEDMLDELGGM